MRQLLLGCLGVIAACLIGGAPAGAQDQRAVQVEPLKFLDAEAVPSKVELLLGKARILELPTDVRDVLVASPDVADVVVRTPRLVYVLGRKVGDTNIFFFDTAGNEIARFNARVELDLSSLEAALKKYLPGADIQASSVNQNVILTGSVNSARTATDATNLAERFVAKAANIINMLNIQADQQVLLRVRVAEMQRTAMKELGLRFDFSSNDGDLTVGTFEGGPPANLGDLFLDTTVTGLNGILFDRFDLHLDALEASGLIKTLAEPNLTALSGETANFLAGGEVPITVASETTAGATTVTVEFKPFGISLDFTPVVLSTGRISLRVHTEVSSVAEATFAGFPSFLTRRASTTVELPSGGSLVIAGLLQDDVTSSINGVPGLKDVPVLGALFRSVNFERRETELVIAVTVHLVRPVDEQEIVLPTDGFAPASDIDMYFFGRLHATYARSESVPSLAELKAPTGYIME